MYPTLLGLALLPLSIASATRPVRLLQLALVAAIFEAGAAIVIGGMGLQPPLVPGLTFLIYVVMQYALGMRYPGEVRVFATLTPLLLLLGYVLFSIAVLPDAFAGKVLVIPQKPDPLAIGTLLPLTYTSGNMTQTLVQTPAMISVLRPVARTVLTKSSLSHALTSPLRGT